MLDGLTPCDQSHNKLFPSLRLCKHSTIGNSTTITTSNRWYSSTTGRTGRRPLLQHCGSLRRLLLYYSFVSYSYCYHECYGYCYSNGYCCCCCCCCCFCCFCCFSCDHNGGGGDRGLLWQVLLLKTGRVMLNGMSFHDIWFSKLTSQSSLCSGATPVAEPALRRASLGTGKGRAHSWSRLV